MTEQHEDEHTGELIALLALGWGKGFTGIDIKKELARPVHGAGQRRAAPRPLPGPQAGLGPAASGERP